MEEKFVSRQILGGDVIGNLGNVLFKLFYLTALVSQQNLLRYQQVKQFLLYF
jgi:hypothetical protein